MNDHPMTDHQVADLLEIQQLAVRYMSCSAAKEQDLERWREVFTPDAEYHAFGSVYHLDDFPMLIASAPAGQYVGNAPLVELGGDTATGVQHYVFVDQATHDMRLAWYDDDYVRTDEGWRFRRRRTTFMRRNGTYDAGKPHDPARHVPGGAGS